MRERVKLFLEGHGHGGGRWVPGVSGGTIAFISGIYEELLASIRAPRSRHPGRAPRAGSRSRLAPVQRGFLLTLVGRHRHQRAPPGPAHHLVAGTPTRDLELLLRPHRGQRPRLGRLVSTGPWARSWAWCSVRCGLCGGRAPCRQWLRQPVVHFLAGAIAICATILPGISGSFILLLLGAYGPVMEAVKSFDLVVVGTMGLGAILGLMSFSRLLTWMFQRHHDLYRGHPVRFSAGL